MSQRESDLTTLNSFRRLITPSMYFCAAATAISRDSTLPLFGDLSSSTDQRQPFGDIACLTVYSKPLYSIGVLSFGHEGGEEAAPMPVMESGASRRGCLQH